MVLPMWVQEKLSTLRRDFTGSVEINCLQGGVVNVNVRESFKQESSAAQGMRQEMKTVPTSR